MKGKPGSEEYKQYYRDRYQKNKADILFQKKGYYHCNQNKVKRKCLRYYRTHKSERQAYKKEYDLKRGKQAISEARRSYYLKDKFKAFEEVFEKHRDIR